MLSLVQLKAINFRSIREETFSFKALSVLIGKNNSGKTNVLDAMAILLEGTSRDVTKEDFFNPSANFIIEGRFVGVRDYLNILDERHRPRIEERIDDEGCITIRRVGHTAEHTLDKIGIRHPTSDVFDTPTGIDAALRQVLPEIIFVRPLADVADELSGKTSSALTKILAQITEHIESQAQPLLEKAHEQANALLNVVPDPADTTKEVDNRLEALKEIEASITSYLQETFRTSRARLKMEMPTVKQILGNIEMLISEGTLWKPYYRQGHGLQRVLLLSLLRALAVRLRQSPENKMKRPFILLIEEPELFLHPVAQEQMRDALEAISTSNQVIYATHSPLLVSVNCLPGLVRMHKVLQAPQSIEETNVAGTPVTEDSLGSDKDILTILNLQRSAQLFFATTVVLVEGEGDRYLHRALFENLRGIKLESEDIVLVEIGGKDRLARIKRLLGHFCPRVVSLADLDYIWTHAGTELGANPDLSQLCEALKTKVEQELSSIPNLTDEAMKKQRKRCMIRLCTSDAFCKKRDTVCEQLECLGTFVLRQGEIEDYVGLEEVTKGSYLNVAREIASGERKVNFEPELRDLYRRLQNWCPVP